MCVYPEAVDEERDGCEEDGGGSGRSRGCSVPWGLIVKARLNGAGAGKVSVQRGRKEEEVLQLHGRTTLNTTFHTVCIEKRAGGGAKLPERQKCK